MRSVGGDAAVPHAIVMTWSFPPVDSSLSRRSAALVAALVDEGWRVTVLTVHSPAAVRDDGVDPALDRGVPASVTVVRIEDDQPDQIQRIDRWPHERALDPEGWRDAWLARTTAQFDEPGFGHLYEQLHGAALRLTEDETVDLVVAVAGPMKTQAGAPMVPVAVAGDVSARHGAPLVVDFARVSDADLAIGERRVDEAISSATTLWCPDEATRDRLRAIDEHVAARAVVVPDGHGGPLPDRIAEPDPARPLRVGCFVEPDAWGGFVEVVEGWLAARETETFADAELSVYGRLPSATVPGAVLAQCADRGVTFRGQPYAEELPTVHAGLDLVVVLSRGDLPAGRTTAHLAAGAPVVWCAVGPCAPGHVLATAAHVVRAETLRRAGVSAALAAALEIDPASIVVPERASGWPAAVATLAAGEGR